MSCWRLIIILRFDAKIEHYRVINKNSKVTVDEEEYFESLTELVAVILYNIHFVLR